MQDLNDKVNNGGTTPDGQLTADEWNEVPSELQNIIESSGQTLASGSLDQTAKAISKYSGVGDFFIGSGTVNSYVATEILAMKAPNEVVDGLKIRLKINITNTGASTLNAFSTGVTNIKLRGGINDVGVSALKAGVEYTFIYRTSPSVHWELKEEDKIIFVDNVAEMVARTSLKIGDIVSTLGRFINGDGGANTYKIVAAATGTDDGGSFIDLITHQAQGLFRLGTVNVAQFGAVGGANDTQEIQAAIDYRSIGGGEVSLFPVSYGLGASTLTNIFDNNGNNKAATDGCLILWSGVFLRGAGIGKTRLLPNDKDLSCIFHISPEIGGISDLEIDSDWTLPDTETAGHGIFCMDLTSSISDRVYKNITYSNLLIQNQAAYGIGLQGRPDIENVLYQNIKIKNTGLDGIDLKYRGPNMISKGCFLSDIAVEKPGQRSSLQAGVDVRGRWRLNNIDVRDIGVVGLDSWGIRFRTYSIAEGNGPDNQADYSSMTNFYVECNGLGDNIGVSIGSANVAISTGIIIGALNGINITGNPDGSPDGALINNIHSIDATNYGFWAGADGVNVTFNGCTAVNATTVGFRNEGVNTVYSSCTDRGSTLNYSGSVASNNSMVAMGNSFPGDNWISQFSGTDYTDLVAIGGDINIDIRLNPKGAGNVRFGTRVASGDVAITGYIEIKDVGGTVRKLAIIA